MTSLFMFRFVLFFCLVLLSARYGKGNHDKCPRSFGCGELGRINFPFTKAERQDCGLIPIHGCDEPSSLQSHKTIELEKNGRPLWVIKVLQEENIIIVFDNDLHESLKSRICGVFKNNITFPSNSLVSFHIRNYATLFRCNHGLNVSPPTGFFKHACPDYEYDIYYDGSPGYPPNHDQNQSSFSACEILQLPIKDLSDTQDLPSFLTGHMVIEVRLSDDCNKCCNQMGGQCRLDDNNNFYCDIAALAKHKMKVLKLALELGLGLFIGLSGIPIIWQLLERYYKRKYTPSHVQLQPSSKNAIDPSPNADPRSSRAYFGVHLFSYEELAKATNNFNRSRELGHGGFGIVYYGTLQDGREVAVKRLYDHNYRRVEQFMNEIQILTRLRHRNLVSLYGCTSRHSRELLLVYEYIPNRTVACHLHSQLADRCLLPWPIRIQIAIETATALAYLHASGTIHRDVKTNNILLDNSFCVKVADFGLSRLFPNDVTHVSTAPQGTPGYVDPEYHQCYQLTNKSDVYSFGVVLIELISSMPAVDMSRHKDEINLANLAVKKIQKGAFRELVDPSLGFESDNEVRRMMVSVAELAFQCLQSDKELRPSMDEVLEMLRRIKSGKEELDHVEEVDIYGADGKCVIINPPSPPSLDCNEAVLKTIKSMPSPKEVIDKWHSESTKSCVSA